MGRIEKPTAWSYEERLRVIERLLYRVAAERLNVDRRARIVNLALDVAKGAPPFLELKWAEIEPLVAPRHVDGLSV